MSSLEENPLLIPSNLKKGAVRFDKIKAEHFMPALEQLCKEAQVKFAKIIEHEKQPNYENTIKPYNQIFHSFDTIVSVSYQLHSAVHSSDLSETMLTFSPLLEKTFSAMNKNPQFFRKIETVYKNEMERNSLNHEELRYLDLLYERLVLEGTLLSEENRKKLMDTDEEIELLGNQFSQNLIKFQESFRFYLTDKKALEGLPEDCVLEAKKLAEKEKKEGWAFTSLRASYVPFLYYCKRRDLRKKFFKLISCRNYKDEFDNSEIVLKIIDLRLKKAKLLGFSNYSEYKLKKSMAKSPHKVISFLENLLKAYRPKALKELKEVKDLALKEDGIEDFQYWDLNYYSDKLMKKKFDIDTQKLREYFPLEKSLEGLFEHAKRLYDLEFKKTKNYPVYEETVKVYEVYRKGDYRGLLYLDLFSRDTKSQGAWKTRFKPQGSDFLGTRSFCHALICCNFPKPSKSKPSLLTQNDVRTLFHEFGHALHDILSDCKMSSLSGTAVFIDFVELPSQIMENWIYEKESLQLISEHYETAKPLPDDLFAKIKGQLQFQSGIRCLRQLSFGFLDMAWHNLSDLPDISLLEDFEAKATKKAQLLAPLKKSSSSCHFAHIFSGGYDSGYYGYKWAEVLDADAYKIFQEEGIFNKEVAERFRDSILSRGNTEDPLTLYKRFRKREPDIRALLEREGLVLEKKPLKKVSEKTN